MVTKKSLAAYIKRSGYRLPHGYDVLKRKRKAAPKRKAVTKRRAAPKRRKARR
jgi:hypothetical protein